MCGWLCVHLSAWVVEGVAVLTASLCGYCLLVFVVYQSILAPMAGFSVVWNIILSPYVLKEKLSVHDLKGTAVILVGCMMVGLSGSHVTPKHESTEIFALFTGSIFIRYAIAAIAGAIGVRDALLLEVVFELKCTQMALLTVCMNIFSLCTSFAMHRERADGVASRTARSRGSSAATSSSSRCVFYKSLPIERICYRLEIDFEACLFIAQASVELLTEGGTVWSYAETYLIIVAALSSAGGGIYVLDLGLREYDALYLVAIYQAFLILIGSISGVIFFHENAGMNSWWQSCLYPLSIVTTVAGVIILSDKQTDTQSSGESEKTADVNSTDDEDIPLMISSGKGVNHGAINSV